MESNVSNIPTEYAVSDMSNRAMALFFATLFLPVAEIFIVSALGAGGFALLGCIVLTYAAAIYLYRKTQRKMLVTINGDRIAIVYTQKPLFERVNDRDCALADIQSYSYNDVGGPKLVLYFNDGTKFRAMAGTVGKKREPVERLAGTLIPLIENSNTREERTTTSKRRKSFYEGTGGLVLAISLLAVVAATVLAVIFLPNNHKTTDVIKAIGYDIGALVMALRIFSLRKTNKAKEKAEAEMRN